MWLKLGNDSALEAEDDGNGGFNYVPAEGERVTTFNFTDDTTPMQALSMVAACLPKMMRGTPAWVESDDERLVMLVKMNFNLSDDPPPATWGSNLPALTKAAPKKARKGKASSAEVKVTPRPEVEDDHEPENESES